MRSFISNRMLDLKPNPIREMTRLCQRVGGINLGQGVCDLPTPPPIRQGAIKAIEDRKNVYSLPEGILDLRQVIAKKLLNENGIRANPETEIVITVGSTGAYANTLLALFNPGDGILLFEPYYGYHVEIAHLVGLEPQYCALKPPNFTVTEELLSQSLQPNTKAIVICTPANPSGKMFNEKELGIIAKVAHEKDLLVITDEVYEYFRYDGRPHISPATIGNLWSRSITMMGLSKTFAITGWRIGYVVAPEHFSRLIRMANDLFYVCAPTPLQQGVADGFQLPPSFYEALQKDYQDKRDQICSALRKVKMDPIVPQGAYYVLADVSSYAFKDCFEAAMALLDKAKVAAIPGRAFYHSNAGDQQLRFSFGLEDHVLKEACKRIEGFRK